jgi:hypothetical protein
MHAVVEIMGHGQARAQEQFQEKCPTVFRTEFASNKGKLSGSQFP